MVEGVDGVREVRKGRGDIGEVRVSRGERYRGRRRS